MRTIEDRGYRDGRSISIGRYELREESSVDYQMAQLLSLTAVSSDGLDNALLQPDYNWQDLMHVAAFLNARFLHLGIANLFFL